MDYSNWDMVNIPTLQDIYASDNPNMSSYLDFSSNYYPDLDTSSFYTPASGSGDTANPAQTDLPALRQWLDQNGYSIRDIAPSATGLGYGQRALFDQNNSMIGSPQSYSNDDSMFATGMALASSLINPTALGSAMGLSGGLGTAAGSALLGAGQAGWMGQDPLKGALLGGLSGGITAVNPASYAGITNPTLQRAINSGIMGVGQGLATDQNPLLTGLTAALPSMLTYGSQSLGDIFGGGTTSMPFGEFGNQGVEYNPQDFGVGDYTMEYPSAPTELSAPAGDMSYATVSPDISNFNADSAINWNTMNIASAGVPQEAPPMSAGGGESEGGGFMSTIGGILSNGIPNPFGGANIPIGDFAGGLMDIYSSLDQRRRAKRLIGNLESLYGLNSPYAQNMQQQLQRRDAASGRRSQYGPRASEFAARMADVNARMAPTLMQLNNQYDTGNLNLARGLLSLGGLFAKPNRNQPTSSIAQNVFTPQMAMQPGPAAMPSLSMPQMPSLTQNSDDIFKRYYEQVYGVS